MALLGVGGEGGATPPYYQKTNTGASQYPYVAASRAGQPMVRGSQGRRADARKRRK